MYDAISLDSPLVIIRQTTHTVCLSRIKKYLMKDENGIIMTEFVEFRAKMYEVRMDGKKDTKKTKDVKSKDVSLTITFYDYMHYLNEEIEMTGRQSYIRSRLHDIRIESRSEYPI